MLDTTYLYVFTTAKHKVSIFVDDNKIFSQYADVQGDVIFPLTKLKYVCKTERTASCRCQFWINKYVFYSMDASNS